MQFKKSVLTLVLSLVSVIVLARTDSTGLKIFSNNKVFIVHQMEKGQGLYTVSKRYKVSLDDIYAYNPELKTNGVKLDQYIFIPTDLSAEKAKELIAAADEKKKAIENGMASPKSREDNVVYYTVKASETLFSISRLEQCKFTISEIKRWNNLTSNSLSEGQRLIIAFRQDVKMEKDPVSVKEVKEAVGSKVTNDSDTAKTVVWSDKSETGLATWIPENDDDQGKSYALYDGSKIGTIIRVENLVNKKATYVRVVGPLPSDQKGKVVVVLTETAARKLETKDPSFRVELVYSNDEL